MWTNNKEKCSMHLTKKSSKMGKQYFWLLPSSIAFQMSLRRHFLHFSVFATSESFNMHVAECTLHTSRKLINNHVRINQLLFIAMHGLILEFHRRQVKLKNPTNLLDIISTPIQVFKVLTWSEETHILTPAITRRINCLKKNYIFRSPFTALDFFIWCRLSFDSLRPNSMKSFFPTTIIITFITHVLVENQESSPRLIAVRIPRHNI